MTKSGFSKDAELVFEILQSLGFLPPCIIVNNTLGVHGLPWEIAAAGREKRSAEMCLGALGEQRNTRSVLYLD